jgi:hypothetical protein
VLSNKVQIVDGNDIGIQARKGAEARKNSLCIRVQRRGKLILLTSAIDHKMLLPAEYS